MRSYEDPPRDVPGMAAVRLDTRGRLLDLEIVPAEKRGAPADSARSPDWDALFAAAELDRASFRPVAPEWTPPLYVDRHVAWVGALPGKAGPGEVRVEAGALDGKPTWFALRGPWSRDTEQVLGEVSRGDRVIEAVIVIAIFGTFLGGFLLAMRNVKLGRGDRAGARRLSTMVAVTMVVIYLFSATHSSRPADEVNQFLDILGDVLVASGLFWAVYLALEPYVRRTWPERIVGWSRVLTGRLADPLVGRDILVGAAFFLANTLHDLARHFLASWRGMPLHRPEISDAGALLGATGGFAALLNVTLNSIFAAMFFLLLLFFLRLILRDGRAAMIGYVVLFGVFAVLVAPERDRLAEGILGLVLGAMWLFVLVRFGLLAFLVGLLFGNVVGRFPMTFESSHWYFGGTVLASVVVLAVTLYGLKIAIAGKTIIQE
jgi:hypothetical protein